MGIATQETKSGFQSIKVDVKNIQGIEDIEIELCNSLSSSKGEMREMCRHILNAGGKRIRPLLVLHSGLAFNGSLRRLLQAGAAAELIHAASLVHDDIIDNSFMRRTRPSINKIWGSHYAVLCGDYLFSRAFGILSRNRLIKSMDLMVEAIENMCQGEIIQASERFNCDIGIERYYEIISMKTAIFLSCCCKSGAAASGAADLQVQILGEYGLNLGYAFQIIDDILDFCGKCEVTGKPKGEDLRQGNITLPIIMLSADKGFGDWTRDVIGKKCFTQESIDRINDLLNNTGIIEECYKVATAHINKAKDCISLLPASRHSEFLKELADMLQARAN